MAAPRNPALVVGLRVLIGVGIYFVLVPLWLLTGLDTLYDRAVIGAAEALVPFLTHFPVGSTAGVELLDVHDRAFALIWIVAMALVVKGVPWGQRFLRYLPLMVAVLVLHVVGQALQLYLGLVLKAQASLGVSLLLPWELGAITWISKALFLAGLQLAPFVSMVLTAYWSTDRKAVERPRPPVKLAFTAAGAAIVATVVLLVVVWWIREKDPRHGGAHARLGDAFVAERRLAEAEGQYRAALRAGPGDGRTWLSLIVVVYQQGRPEQAEIELGRAAEVVTDPEWVARLGQIRAELRGAADRPPQ